MPCSFLPLAAAALVLAAAPSAAQTLEGRALDRETQQPVPAAEVTLVDAQGEAAGSAVTGADGTFRVAAPAPGDYRLAARRLGYQVMLSNVLPLAQGQTLQVEARLTPQPVTLDTVTTSASAPGIHGRVAEAETGRGIAGTRVSLLNERSHTIERAVTDGEGNFHLPVPQPGRLRLRAYRMGYRQATSDAITVVPGDTLQVELLMSTDAVVLAPLTVVASSRSVARNSRMAGFEWRQQNHPWGRFIGPERIASIRPFYATDVLQQIPFLQIRSNGLERVPLMRGRFGRCIPTIYVDGHPTSAGGTGFTVDEIVNGPDIAAVEVYDRPFEAPAQFMPTGSQIDCGVIVIWTRPPEPRGGSRRP